MRIQIIHDFVDGALDSQQEDNLFMAMATNEGMRAELKQYIDFELTARNDFAAYTTPAESTEAIFSRLNIAPMVAPGSGSILAAFWQKAGKGITNTALTALVSVIAMYFIMQPGTTETQQATGIATNNSSNMLPTYSMNVPVIGSVEKENIVQSKPEIKYIVKYIKEPAAIADVEDNMKINAAEPETDSKTIGATRIVNGQYFSAINIGGGKAFPTNGIDMTSAMSLPQIAYKGERIGINAEFAGADYYSFPKADMNRSSEPILENTGIKLLYDITGDLSAGLDFRQEFFYLTYDGIEEDQAYLYDQHPNFYALGLTCKYKPEFLQIGGFISPYIEGGAGMTKIGPIGRLLLGAEIMVYERYGFILGVEGSMLRFSHENKNFWSKKLGFQYGVIFKL